MLQNITWLHLVVLIALILVPYRIIRARRLRATQAESGALKETQE